MNVEVSQAIKELECQFSGSAIVVNEDGQGGAKVIIKSITLSDRFIPNSTWFGFHITAQYPYADIYPVFMGAEVIRADGVEFSVPITRGHQFEQLPAIQISRRNGNVQNGMQKATTKILKILDFLEKT